MNVYVILGNDALVRCTIPSFVADFVSVVGWVDSEGNQFYKSGAGRTAGNLGTYIGRNEE